MKDRAALLHRVEPSQRVGKFLGLSLCAPEHYNLLGVRLRPSVERGRAGRRKCWRQDQATAQIATYECRVLSAPTSRCSSDSTRLKDGATHRTHSPP